MAKTMRVLVGYASRLGSTRDIATRIADRRERRRRRIPGDRRSPLKQPLDSRLATNVAMSPAATEGSVPRRTSR
jgi:flavodoxin